MDIETYEELTGTTVPTSKTTFYEATILRVQSMLELILGYSLEVPADPETRVYDYHHNDKYIHIDPAEDITEIKLIRDDEVIYTLDEEEYRLHEKYDFIKYIEICSLCYTPCKSCTQLSVTGTWKFDELPQDLLYVWADMITYYADHKNNIKSETLGTHSYTKYDMKTPQEQKENHIILMKYAGPNGSAIPTITV